MMMNSHKILVFLILLLSACKEVSKTEKSPETLPYYQDAFFTPKWLASSNNISSTFHQIPAFQLTNQRGETVTEKTVENKIYVANFFFTTCPGICPKMTSNLSILQEEFANDTNLLLLSHSVTPDKDSVEVLANYARKSKITSKQWHLLTGDRKQIYNLGRSFYFVEEDLGIEKDPNDFLHTENFVLIDKNRHIRGIYNGLNKTSVNQLIKDIYTLKEE